MIFFSRAIAAIKEEGCVTCCI